LLYLLRRECYSGSLALALVGCLVCALVCCLGISLVYCLVWAAAVRLGGQAFASGETNCWNLLIKWTVNTGLRVLLSRHLPEVLRWMLGGQHA
jgi:hypothetical protein